MTETSKAFTSRTPKARVRAHAGPASAHTTRVTTNASGGTARAHRRADSNTRQGSQGRLASKTADSSAGMRAHDSKCEAQDRARTPTQARPASWGGRQGGVWNGRGANSGHSRGVRAHCSTAEGALPPPPPWKLRLALCCELQYSNAITATVAGDYRTIGESGYRSSDGGLAAIGWSE
eukprot:6194161-Pleurochrysis_carterae.AAC.1